MANEIHETVVISGDVRLGQNNRILPFTVLIGPLSIGDDNIIGPHVVIGSPGQDTRNPRYDSSCCEIRIGSRNIIREFTAIQKPCYERVTQIGDDNYFMQSVHVPHDAMIEDKTVLTPMVAMGGMARVMEGANLALGVSVHQRIVVGAYSIAGMGAVVMKNIRPFSRYVPNKPISVNQYAIDKFGFEAQGEEIARYVLDRAEPTSARVMMVVRRYEELCALHKNGEY